MLNSLNRDSWTFTFQPNPANSIISFTIKIMGERITNSGGLVNRIPTSSNAIQNITSAKICFAEVRKCFELNKSCKKYAIYYPIFCKNMLL